MIPSLWRKQPGKALGRRGRLANPRVRPRLEVLEDRTLLSVLTVLNNNDSGPDSLRDALSRAANGDVINFDKSLAGSTITLTSGELSVAASVKIQGLGADQLTVSGNFASRVFNVAPGVLGPENRPRRRRRQGGRRLEPGHVVGERLHHGIQLRRRRRRRGQRRHPDPRPRHPAVQLGQRRRRPV
jgi:hypothetical protein